MTTPAGHRTNPEPAAKPTAPCPRPAAGGRGPARDCRTPTTSRSPTPDRWPPGRPEYAIVVDQLRGWQPGGPPSLAELLETGRTREPEPDLEAEP